MKSGATFEQLFYGSGRDGYGILAASPGAGPFRAAVLSLCESFGTPSGAGSIKPFLLCRRTGDHVLFARCVQGRDDPQGRRTVFVHVLVAERKTLESAGTDPFALARCGLFCETLPNGTPGAIDLDLYSLSEATQVGGPTLPLPIIVQGTGPVSSTLVRSALGDRPWEQSWATWSWRFLDGFAFQGLSARTPVPDFVALCDETGKLLRAPSKTIPSPVQTPPLSSGQAASSAHVDALVRARGSDKRFAFSLLVNAALVLVCAWLVLHHRDKDVPPPDEKQAPNQTASELAIILEESYPGWRSGSLDIFLAPTTAIDWKNSPREESKAVYRFLEKSYDLAVRSAKEVGNQYIQETEQGVSK